MNAHSNAKLTPVSRAEMVRRVVQLHRPAAEVAAGFGISVRSARKWLARFRAEGNAGLQNRSSRPTDFSDRDKDMDMFLYQTTQAGDPAHRGVQ